MTDEKENGLVCLADPFGYDDTIAQRATAFAQLAALTSTIKDNEIRELSLIMMKKINASIKVPSTAKIEFIHNKTDPR